MSAPTANRIATAAKPSPHSTSAMKPMIPITGQKVTPARPINSPRLSDLSSEFFNRIIVSHKPVMVKWRCFASYTAGSNGGRTRKS
jgi:hypothetical protein